MTNPATGAERPEICPRCGSHDPAQYNLPKCNPFVFGKDDPDPWHDASPVSPATPEKEVMPNDESNDTSAAFPRRCDIAGAAHPHKHAASAAPSGNGSAKEQAFQWLKQQPGPLGVIDVPRLLAQYAEKFAEVQGERVAELEASRGRMADGIDMDDPIHRKINADGRLYFEQAADYLWRAEKAESALKRYEALDAHLPPGFAIGDDATAELALKLVELESESRLSRAAGARLLRKYGRHLPTCYWDKVEYANKEKVCSCGFQDVAGEFPETK